MFRVYDFNVKNIQVDSSDGSDSDASGDNSDSEYAIKGVKNYYNRKFVIQIFGINELGETCSIQATGFKPYFYIKVGDNWKPSHKRKFIAHIQSKIGDYYGNCICGATLLKRRKLYMFDNYKQHKFIKIEFTNTVAMKKVADLWFSPYSNDSWDSPNRTGHELLKDGYPFSGTKTMIYESNIPPLLKFIHVQDINPSGWIELPSDKTNKVDDMLKTTPYNHEYTIRYSDIISHRTLDKKVPYKIMSFDIEASSSHGDFPVPRKSYLKLATNIIDYFTMYSGDCTHFTREQYNDILEHIVMTSFGACSQLNEGKGVEPLSHIDLVFPKHRVSVRHIQHMIGEWIHATYETIQDGAQQRINTLTITKMFNTINAGIYAGKNNNDESDESDDESDDESEDELDDYSDDELETLETQKEIQKKNMNKITPYDILTDRSLKRQDKINRLDESLMRALPELKGDIVTTIGSTFMRYGEKTPYKNHSVVLGSCSTDTMDDITEIETVQTEKEVLLAWQKLVQREDPDIIIGYNIFGFDYNFMFIRAQENNCEAEFLKMSKNTEEICGNYNNKTMTYSIKESSITVASGQHITYMIEMPGRLQIDMLGVYRKNGSNFESYKLDNVAGYLIGDNLKGYTINETENDITTTISTKNMIGLCPGNYVRIEETDNSTVQYERGKKFPVLSVDFDTKTFIIQGRATPNMTKKVRWCMAKDDVSPKDIFRLTNGDEHDRAIVTKYCIQDCNLVQYLCSKSDVMTGFIEQANICNVPINFIVMRGQGIKLTSLIVKRCNEQGVLVPVIPKGQWNEAYQGARVLIPKTGIYTEIPVACNDYGSLYPSIMRAENYSQDSKVWTKEYLLDGTLISDIGEKNENGEYIYDNLPGIDYETAHYDTYRWVKNPAKPAAKAKKVLNGYKLCRYVQSDENYENSAIIPNILADILGARKATRKLIPQQTTEFMKQVMNQRQLGYKIVANSLYGGCGAKTSSFYDIDIAACTTSTGQLLLEYAKSIIEQCYGNAIVEIENYGTFRTRAEYIYGDTDSVFFAFNFETLDGEPVVGQQALEMTILLSPEAGEIATMFLKQPHDLEYEKTYLPYLIISKKRYAGQLFSTDPKKSYRDDKGLVLTRRDNAPIVKDIYGGIIDLIMSDPNLQHAIDFLDKCLTDVASGACDWQKLIISKSIRSGYKNPDQIAHKVLADRIADRDPGNTPTSGDRIPYMYFVNSNKKALQKDRIETPEFIREQNLKIDYAFYITNQIMKPVQQLFALALEQLWKMKNIYMMNIRTYRRSVAKFTKELDDPKKLEAKINKLRFKEINKLLFDKHLVKAKNVENNQASISTFFGAVKSTPTAESRAKARYDREQLKKSTLVNRKPNLSSDKIVDGMCYFKKP